MSNGNVYHWGIEYQIGSPIKRTGQGDEKLKIKTGKESEYVAFKEENTLNGRNSMVISYAERWADMMEQRISNGASVFQRLSALRTYYPFIVAETAPLWRNYLASEQEESYN